MSTIGIEALLRWAFVMELTKAGDADLAPRGSGGGWSAFERLAELGTLVDGRGAAPDWSDPHPDAVAIKEAVADLDVQVVHEGEDHDLFAGWGDFGEAGDAAVARAWEIITIVDGGLRLLRSPLSALVRRVAVLGEWPDWRGEAPTLQMATSRKGEALWFRTQRVEVRWDQDGAPTRWEDVETDGYDRVRRRPHKGAYHKSVLSHDVAPVLARRLEYGLTHAALVSLAARLDGLGGRRVLPPIAPALPWAGGEVEKIVT